MNIIIDDKRLSNNVRVLLVNDSFLDYNLTIKFNNYGAILDAHHNVYGLQHLLEHAIFYNGKDLNLDYNAQTSVHYMALQLSLPSNIETGLYYLRKWLFQNDDYTKIDFSRRMSTSDVKMFVNELDSEYKYRDILNIPWDSQFFLLTEGKANYMGGNYESFKEREDIIKRYLAAPEPIEPRDIVIMLGASKSEYYNKIVNLFSQLRPLNIKKDITYPIHYHGKKFYDNIIQLNNGNTNYLSFVLQPNTWKETSFLHHLSSLYPFMNFSKSLTNEIFINFSFENIKDLYSFYSLLEHRNMEGLSLNNNNNTVTYYLEEMRLDEYGKDLLALCSQQNTYADLFLRNEKKITKFFNVLFDLVDQRKFLINTTKTFLQNRKTNIEENYYIHPVNFNYDYFGNNFDLTDIYKNFRQTVCLHEKQKNIFYLHRNNNHLACGKALSANSCQHSIQTKNKKSFTRYLQAIQLFLITPNHSSLEEILSNSSAITYKKNSNCHIDIKNDEYKIKTEYDFLLCAIKIKKSNKKKIKLIADNVQETLKSKGLCYYLHCDFSDFNDDSIVFFHTITDPRNYAKIINILHNNLLTNTNSKIKLCKILSYKIKNNYENIDISSLKKNVMISF